MTEYRKPSSSEESSQQRFTVSPGDSSARSPGVGAIQRPKDSFTDQQQSPADRSSVSHRTSSTVQTRRTWFRRTIQQQRPGNARNTLKAVIKAAEQQSLREQQDLLEEHELRKSASQDKSANKHLSKSNSLRNVMDAVQSHFQDLQVTRIQALYRGHQTRRSHHSPNQSTSSSPDRFAKAAALSKNDVSSLLPLSSPPLSLSPPRTPISRRKIDAGVTPGLRGVFRSSPPTQHQYYHFRPQKGTPSTKGSNSPSGRQHYHRRVASEITMSDFEESLFGGDSFSSIDSMTLSPRTNMKRNNDSFGTGAAGMDEKGVVSKSGAGMPGWFQNSSYTETTAAPTDHSESEEHHQASFSSLFSADTSMDIPIKVPFRKATPPRSFDGFSAERSSVTPRKPSVTGVVGSPASQETDHLAQPSLPYSSNRPEQTFALPNLPIPDMPPRIAQRLSGSDDEEVAMATQGEVPPLDTPNNRFGMALPSRPKLRPRTSASTEEWSENIQTFAQSFTSLSFDSDEAIKSSTRQVASAPTLTPLVAESRSSIASNSTDDTLPIINSAQPSYRNVRSGSSHHLQIQHIPAKATGDEVGDGRGDIEALETTPKKESDNNTCKDDES